MKAKELCFLVALCLAPNIQAQLRWGDWQAWGEQADGTFCNPIIPSDYSDLDCIQVGDTYYAITSTFQFSPGVTIIRSRDLVNWEFAGHAVHDLTQIGPELNWDRMNRYGVGIWAGTLRHHAGRFYLFFGCPDEGFFMTSAEKAEGPWDDLTCLLPERGWDDCTAYWDERTGQAWFVGTHFADGYKSYLMPMTEDGRSIDFDKRRIINEGNGREASKIIRHGDYYYLVFSEHRGGIGRYVMAKRTKALEDGFAEEKQLAVASTEANEPNQGGIIQAPNGQWHFLTHHGSGDWSGRIVSLLPVIWIDGWPIIGALRPDGLGQMQWTASMPTAVPGGSAASAVERPVIGDSPAEAPIRFAPTAQAKPHLQRSDDFDEVQLQPQWQWNYQPRQDYFSLTERPGWLRLKAFRPLEYDKLLKAGNTLTARTFRVRQSIVTIRMDITQMADGQRCGLCHFSAASSAIGVAQENGARCIEFRENDNILRVLSLSPVSPSYIWLRSEWGLDGRSTYYYSLDGDNFHTFGEYQLQWGNYRGDRYGIYCFNNQTDAGLVDIDYCHYEMVK